MSASVLGGHSDPYSGLQLFQLFVPFSPIPTGFGYGPPPPPPDQFAPPGVPPPPATPGAAPLAFPPPPSQAAPDMSKPPTAQPDFPYGQYGKWVWLAAPRMGRSRRGHQTGFWDAVLHFISLWGYGLPEILLSPALVRITLGSTFCSCLLEEPLWCSHHSSLWCVDSWGGLT